ncbi:MAG: glycerol-3-phosphate 1-O-acyltransferase PlsY [Clostridia bacterium]|nr:glycerol-3-phosphate 1-O-acyltransferase PlsY [Clostridia bacterium]
MTLTDFFTSGLFGVLLGSGLEDGLKIALVILLGAVCIAAPYLLGSMNFAIIISKVRYKSDIRNYGSGNAGATNMMRTFGKSAAGLTFLGDALKAFVAGMIGYATLGQFGAYLAGMFCILGHMFPIYYNFKGGKGVVTASISVLMCNPFVFLILLLLFVIIVGFTKYISLGSVMCMLIYPLILHRINNIMGVPTGIELLIAIANAAMIIFMHRENIKRLLAGKENKFSFKKSVKAEDSAKAENSTEK